MKKRLTKLTLHRDTVLNLTVGLDRAQGGFETQENSCPYTHPVRLCITIAVWCTVDYCP
mgnify:CR=1 FL=1